MGNKLWSSPSQEIRVDCGGLARLHFYPKISHTGWVQTSLIWNEQGESLQRLSGDNKTRQYLSNAVYDLFRKGSINHIFVFHSSSNNVFSWTKEPLGLCTVQFLHARRWQNWSCSHILLIATSLYLCRAFSFLCAWVLESQKCNQTTYVHAYLQVLQTIVRNTLPSLACFPCATLWKQPCHRLAYMILTKICTLTSFTMTSFENQNFTFLGWKNAKSLHNASGVGVHLVALTLYHSVQIVEHVEKAQMWISAKTKVDTEQVERLRSHCLTSVTTCFVLQIVIEGVKAGPSEEGDLAFDDVLLLDTQCPTFETCDFESNMCSWSNVGSDEDDWFRRRGNSRGPPGPSVDHTTLTPFGQLYL